MADADDWITPPAAQPQPAQAPMAFPGGGGQMPGGEATNDPATFARWLAEDKIRAPQPAAAGMPSRTPADAARHSVGADAIANVRAGLPAIKVGDDGAPQQPVDDWVTPAAPPKRRGMVANLGAGTNEQTMQMLGLPVDAATGLMNLVPRGINAVAGTSLPTIQHPVGGSDWLMDREKSIGIDPRDVEAKTGGEKIGRAAGEGLAAVLLPGAAARSAPALAGLAGAVQEGLGAGATAGGAATGAASGAGSEASGELTAGTPAEPYARMVGALAPGLRLPLPSLRSPSKILGEALRGVTPQQFDDAQALLTQSRVMGAPLTLPEAVQQVTNSGTRLGDIQRVVEQSAAGAPIMRPFFAARPGQTQTFGHGTFDQIAPAGASPEGIGARIQGANQDAVATSRAANLLRAHEAGLGAPVTAEDAGTVIQNDLRTAYDARDRMRGAAADQDYSAARDADYGENGEPQNPVRTPAVIAHVDDLLTSAKGTTAAALRRARATLFSAGQPDMTVTGMDNARKAVADLVSAATQGGRRNEARLLQDVLGQMDHTLERVPAYGQARRNFAAASVPLEPFGEGTAPGRIIERDQFNRRFTMPAEAVPAAIAKGATPVDQFLAAGTASSRAAFVRWFAQRLAGAARDATGRVNPEVLQNTLRENADILRRFPEITRNLNQIADARQALSEVERTTTGRLAQVDRLEQHIETLFNNNPLPGSEADISRAVRTIAARDPEAAQQLVRLHLERTFNEATQANLSGPNQFGGAKFAAVAAGNPQQERNLEAALSALPNGSARLGAFRNTIRILRAQGTRQPVGSQTEFNKLINESLRSATPLTQVAAQATSPWGIAKAAQRIYEDWQFRRNSAQFARIFTEGNVDDLRRLSLAPAGSLRAQAALVAAVGAPGPSGTAANDQRPGRAARSAGMRP